ncbi:MAG: hypothetical protein RL223_3005 [Pseudomonadota bacterium]|jgi:hypothetical protein
MHASGQLGRHHFAFLRALLDGISLERAWQLYMAFTGGPQDLRYYRHRLQQLVQVLAHDGARPPSAAADGDAERLARALKPWLTGRMSGTAPQSAPRAASPAPEADAAAPGSPVLSYEDWRLSMCDEAGIDDDFYSEQEWQELHADALTRGEVRSPPITTKGTSGVSLAELQATTTAITRLLQQDEAMGVAPGQIPGTRQQERLQAQSAVARLETRLAQAPQATDTTSRWLVPALCRTLRRAGIRTLGDLARHIHRHGVHWHRPVTGLGIARARTLGRWLADAELAGLASRCAAVTDRAARGSAGTVRADAARGMQASFEGAVGMGATGVAATTRAVFDPTISPRLDPAHASVQAWLSRYSGPTLRDYSRSADRLMRWCLQLRRIPLARLQQADLDAWLAFIAAPDPGWIQARQRPREHADWRPFRGPLSPASQRQERVALSSLLAHLHGTGLLARPLDLQPAGSDALPPARSDDSRSLDARDWAFIHQVLQERPDSPWRTRLALLLALAGPAGLRLSELAVARLQDLQPGPGAPAGGCWLLIGARRATANTVSMPARQRRVPISAEVLALVHRHHRDMDAGGLGYEPAQLRVQGLPEPVVRSPQALAGPHRDETVLDDWRPLIGILKRPPPRARRDAGIAPAPRFDSEDGYAQDDTGQSDRHGALERSALYQALKRFFRDVARQAAGRPGAPDPVRFLRASTHWLRGAEQAAGPITERSP